MDPRRVVGGQRRERTDELSDVDLFVIVEDERVEEAFEALRGVLQTLAPLVELPRMRYCPERYDYGLRYLDRDLPEPLRADVEALAFVPSLDRPRPSARAQALFDEHLRALDAGEWSLRAVADA